MYDKARALTIIAVFLLIVLIPLWYGLASGGNAADIQHEFAPMLEKLKAERGGCVRSREYMASSHMLLLDQWRDDVVRGDDPFFEMPDGTQRQKSLTRTCLDCHAHKESFCDRCHDYVGAEPYCWDCHVVPLPRTGE